MGTETNLTMKIYRVLALKRGHDIGSLKIIAKDESSAIRCAISVLKLTPGCEAPCVSLRLLDLATFPYKGYPAKVLNREGVFRNGG